MNIKELAPGQSFTSADTFGSVYVADIVRTADGLTSVDYHIDNDFGAKPLRGRMVKPALTTVYLKD